MTDGRTDQPTNGWTDRQSAKDREIERKRERKRESAHERIDDEFPDAFRHQNARNCSEILTGNINENDDDKNDVAMRDACSQWKTQN